MCQYANKGVGLMKASSEQYYIGIGASAGGLEAIESFFKYMPSDSGLIFIVVQHLSPDFKSLMNELLARYTDMDIKIVKDGMATQPNTIYLIPPRNNLSIFHGKLFLEEQSNRGQLNLPIDIFFKSLALDQEKNAIGIILSGTGSDGTIGIKALKEAGGMVMVQDEGSAKFDGMPRSSIATGIVDYVLPPHMMPEEILNYIKHPLVGKALSRHEEGDEVDELTKISAIMRNHGGIDFSSYKESTLIRRIERRVKINRMNSLNDYTLLLKASDKERDTLEREFLIGVTGFFRDMEAFESLEKNVLPELDYSKKTIRVWSAGCSTGEEVYSIAILIKEYLESNNLDCDVKIFATDVDSRAIEIAGEGFYLDSIVADVDQDLIHKYFIKKEGGYKVAEKIRKMVVFAKHNVLKDPPFSKLDLLVCRNLFIYLKSENQLNVLTGFYYSLSPSGFLFLGSSESLGDIASGFRNIDSKWKIYKYKDGYRPPTVGSVAYPNTRVGRSHKIEPEMQLQQSHPAMRIEKLLMEVISSVSPPSMLIDSNDNIVQIINDLSPYIRIQPGRFSNNFNTNMEKDQALFINNIIRRLKSDRKDVVLTLPSKYGDTSKSIVIKGKLIEMSTSNFYLISFLEKENNGDLAESEDFNMSEEVKERVRILENELQTAREGLQATIEELETSNEELQSSNEELIASNEELQSTNEELQSVNEELYTVNNEHQHKIDELTKLNNDLNNLIRNTDVGAIYLDQSLRIRKITPVVPKITNILDSDIGRPINQIALVDGYPGLLEDIDKVFDSLEPVERHIMLRDGNYYEARIRPYRTEYNSAEGVIITMIDITDLIGEQDEVLQLNQRLDRAMELGEMAWWEYQVPVDEVVCSSRMAEMLGYDNDFMVDIQEFYKIIHPEDRAGAQHEISRLIRGDINKLDLIYRVKKADDRYAWFSNRADVYERDTDGKAKRILGTVINLTEHKLLNNNISNITNVTD